MCQKNHKIICLFIYSVPVCLCACFYIVFLQCLVSSLKKYSVFYWILLIGSFNVSSVFVPADGSVVLISGSNVEFYPPTSLSSTAKPLCLSGAVICR